MRWLLVAVLALPGLAGCLSGDAADDAEAASSEAVPFLGYEVPEPDTALDLVMEDLYLPGTDGVTLHVRVTRPAGDGPFATIVQDTPYTAPGCNIAFYGFVIEPPVLGCSEGTFEVQFARRGYAYAHGDLRGTGDSDGCLNLRGQADIADIGAVADGLAAQPWSNGNVGFIGASYPGSTSHMAALSGSEAVKAVVPVVASTSFYHYHHNDGVPYNGNHALGGTNTGYTQQGVTPTANPVSGVQKLLDQPLCPHIENAIEHGGLDQTGAYYDWWQERNLRPLAGTVTVPVLMAQGLADWNVKPDHVASWFNDIPAENKVFIGGQWPHAYPASDDGACGGSTDLANCTVPWGDWWAYTAAFFDTYLKEIDTGMFEGSVAWVQDSSRDWHRSTDWPLRPEQAGQTTLWFHPDGRLAATPPPEADSLSWDACASDRMVLDHTIVGVSDILDPCDDGPAHELVFTTEPFAQDTLISGVPEAHLYIRSDQAFTHLVVVVERLGAGGAVLEARENYGYLNPVFRNGLDAPEAVPVGEAYHVAIDLYPQEDLVKAGESLRVTIRSHDAGRTIEAFDSGVNEIVWDETTMNALILPTRPAELQGLRLG